MRWGRRRGCGRGDQCPSLLATRNGCVSDVRSEGRDDATHSIERSLVGGQDVGLQTEAGILFERIGPHGPDLSDLSSFPLSFPKFEDTSQEGQDAA